MLGVISCDFISFRPFGIVNERFRNVYWIKKNINKRTESECESVLNSRARGTLNINSLLIIKLIRYDLETLCTIKLLINWEQHESINHLAESKQCSRHDYKSRYQRDEMTNSLKAIKCNRVINRLLQHFFLSLPSNPFYSIKLSVMKTNPPQNEPFDPIMLISR
jgi:hypothetical protein